MCTISLVAIWTSSDSVYSFYIFGVKPGFYPIEITAKAGQNEVYLIPDEDNPYEGNTEYPLLLLKFGISAEDAQKIYGKTVEFYICYIKNDQQDEAKKFICTI